MLLAQVGSVNADQLAGLALGCCSWHSTTQQATGENWNEKNLGVTFETGYRAGWMIGAVDDSTGNTQYHAGYQWRWNVMRYVDIGAGCGIVDREDIGTVAVCLPRLAIGTNRMAVEAVYIPAKSGDHGVHAVFLQARLGF
jgi:hypothetical protein